MKPDIIIPITESRNKLLKMILPFIIKNIKSRNIYIITAQSNTHNLKALISKKIHIISEDTVIPNITFQNTKELILKYGLPEKRTGWYFQQFLKLGWALYSKDNPWYITWDADTIPLTQQNFFSEVGKPYFIKKNENHKPYFETLKRLLNIDKQCSFSFIAENMIFSQSHVVSLIQEIEKKGQTNFVEAIIRETSKGTDLISGFSEFETYGNYILAKYSDLYDYKVIRSNRNGTSEYGSNPTRLELFYLSFYYDIVSFELWSEKKLLHILKNKLLLPIRLIIKFLQLLKE